jgi:hypothetical protein
VDTTNSQKKSPRSSTKNESTSETLNGETPQHDADIPLDPHPAALPDEFWERYFDRSFDAVARVRAAKEAAQRAMEEFGDPSEYDVFVLRGGKWVPADEAQAGPGKTQEPAAAAMPVNPAPDENRTNKK